MPISAARLRSVRRFYSIFCRWSIIRLAGEPAIGCDLPSQQHYFGVPSSKIASERSDHADACDKLAVEGLKSIRNTA